MSATQRKPHLYFWDGRWWVSRNGPLRYRDRRGLERYVERVTLNDIDAGTLACARQTARSLMLRG